MPKRLIFLASLLISAVNAFNALAAGPYGNIYVGNWNGGAYTDDKSGAFSHCVAGTTYASGVTVLVGQNAQGAWLIGFGILAGD
jgi:hypothetical protein